MSAATEPCYVFVVAARGGRLRDTAGVASEFVGRAMELDVLAGRFEALARRSGSVVMLTGPAGIGKSALAAEALRRHGDPAHVTVVRGHCPKGGVAPPLWPWQRALRLAGATPEAPRQGNGGAEAGAAAGQRSWSATDPGNAAAAQFLQLSRMSEALVAVASERAVVVLLEDLHWADAASLDLLQLVTGEVAGSGLLVLGTFREPAPEEAGGALADLERYGTAILRLAPFTRDEVARCVGEADVTESYRRTGGLPLLVTALRTNGSNLGTVVSGLLSGLTVEQRAVVQAAAVLGEQLDAVQLAAVLPEMDETAMAQALEAAWHAGVLTAAHISGAGRAYHFAHDLVRDEVLGRIAPVTARALHKAAARGLEQTGDVSEAARIAAHWYRSGRDPGHRAAAAHWFRLAADLAREQHAYADGARHLAHAAGVFDAVDPQRAPALLDLARAEYLAGRYEASLHNCEEAAEAAKANGQPTLLAEIALVLQGVTFPHASEAITRLCRTALAVEDLPDAMRARLLAQLATAATELNTPEMAAECARTALELAEATGGFRAELDAARAVQMTLTHPDDTAQSLRLGERAVALAAHLDDPLAAVLGHQWRVQAGYLLGRLDMVEDAISGIEAIVTRSPLPLTRWHLLRVTAARAVQEGRFAEAWSCNEEATYLARAGGDRIATAVSYVMQQQLAHVRGDAADMSEELWRDADLNRSDFPAGGLLAGDQSARGSGSA
ncbi:AAA family ATPase [Streptomyces spectabilis]|uniref:ATP-binding protein n=1 Tax=Streptomyces spectabilis TaxID=68270 RepID=UPI0033E9A466